MRKRFAAVGLAATLFLGGGAVACGNDAENEAEEIQDEADQIIKEGEEKLDEIQEDLENDNN